MACAEVQPFAAVESEAVPWAGHVLPCHLDWPSEFAWLSWWDVVFEPERYENGIGEFKDDRKRRLALSIAHIPQCPRSVEVSVLAVSPWATERRGLDLTV